MLNVSRVEPPYISHTLKKTGINQEPFYEVAAKKKSECGKIIYPSQSLSNRILGLRQNNELDYLTSIDPDHSVKLTFINNCDKNIYMYWIQYNGYIRMKPSLLKANDKHTEHSFISHPVLLSYRLFDEITTGNFENEVIGVYIPLNAKTVSQLVIINEDGKSIKSEIVEMRQEPLTNEECSLLLHGYMRLFCEEQSLPSDIIRLCVSFYSKWFDLKIVYCDDTTGHIDLSKYQIKAIPADPSVKLRKITQEIEDNIYRRAIRNEYKKLRKMSSNELKRELALYSRRWRSIRFTVVTIDKFGRNDLIKRIMAIRFGNKMILDVDTEFDKLWWSRSYQKRSNPLVHAWVKYEQLYNNGDCNRWVEVPDDAQYTPLWLMRCHGQEFKDSMCLVIERCNVNDWFDGAGTWPREKGEDWREKLKVGDIVEVKDVWDKNYEAVVRDIYPKDHETMAEQCLIHYIGWKDKWDETLDINSHRIMKRYSNCSGPHRKGSIKGYRFSFQDYISCGLIEMKSDEQGTNIDEILSLDYEVSADSVDCVDSVYELADIETYGSEKYARNHKAKKSYSKKKEFRRKWRKYGAKSGDKRIENKMKKYKNRYECFAY